MNNAATAHFYNDADHNESSDVQEEEEMKEKNADIANNYKLMSNDAYYNVMLCVHISHMHYNHNF